MKLSEYLSAKELSPTAFARELRVSPSTVTRWISGDRKPDLSMIALIAVVTDGQVGVSDFVAVPDRPASVSDQAA